MSGIQFSDPEDVDECHIFPFVEIEYQTEELPPGTRYQLPLPSYLCGLESPTTNEKIGVLRLLALRTARVLESASLGVEELELGWFDAWKEETNLQDYLEIATALLAALEITVISTSETGRVTVELNPIIEKIQEFFLEDFIPLWHYMNTANEDYVDDFEFDFSNATFSVEELRERYAFNFLHPEFRVVNLDQIMLGDAVDPVEVIEKASTPQSEAATHKTNQPLERVLQCIIEVLYFFKNSGEISDDRDYFINPENMDSHQFHLEAIVLDSLEISEISPIEQGGYRAVLKIGDQPTKYAEELAYYDDGTDPFGVMEPTGLITLGWYEYYFFTPDDPTELH
jgi:hypothetical protein